MVDEFDVLLFTETFLDEDINTNELGLSSFHVFRCDRSLKSSSHSRGGGVLIAVKNHLSAIQLSPSIDSIEHVFVVINLGGSNKILITNVYIPPSSPIEVYENHCASVSSVLQDFMCDGCEVIVCGDFNFPNVTWCNDEYGATPNGLITQQVTCFSYCMAFFNLKQINGVANARGRYLDLIFSSMLAEVSAVDAPLLECDSHHPALKFDLTVKLPCENMQYDYLYYNFQLANYIDINMFLSYVDWNEIFESTDINVVVDRFYHVINRAIELFVPKRRAKNLKFPRWFNDELKSHIFQKKVAHRDFKQTNSADDYCKFSQLRSECRMLAQECHSKYLKEIESNIQSKKDFWRYINSKKDNFELPKCMIYCDKKSDSPVDIVNMFSEHFSSAYVNHPNKDIGFDYTKRINLNDCYISIMDIFNYISSLDGGFGCGPDGIPACFLLNTKCILSDVLYKIFNLSLSNGVFPEKWKVSFITPIFKGGDRSDITNYRPISKFSVIHKVFEAIVSDKITPYFKHILSSTQHGFVKGKSTVTNLLVYQHSLLNSMEDHYQVDSVYTDFSKAFDRLNISILVRKMEAIGLGGGLLLWLSSFLNNRIQYVKIRNFVSPAITAYSGVPQGGHLSPLLFNCYINDVEEFICHCDKLLYADDLKLFRCIKTVFDCEQLQLDLDAFALWCDLNDLTLNVQKCKTITFSRLQSTILYPYKINSEIVERVQSIKDLGVTFSHDLQFSCHIEMICNRAMKMLGFVMRSLKEFNNIFMLKNVYCALVRSILEYACPVWSPHYNIYISLLERVQKRFLRYIAYRLHIPSDDVDYKDLSLLLNITSLERRRTTYDLCLLFKFINNLIDCPELLSIIGFHAPSRHTRQTQLFNVNYHRTNYGYFCPMSRICRRANALPDDIDLFNMSIVRFKGMCNRL